MLRILGNAGLSAALEERSDFSIRRVLDGNEVFSQFFDAIEGLRVFLVLHLATSFDIAKLTHLVLQLSKMTIIVFIENQLPR